jgi:predicted nucleotidyltransferase
MQTSIEQIEPIVKEVARDLRLQQVILFGSLARGTQSERSDIDLIVVRETSSISPRR